MRNKKGPLTKGGARLRAYLDRNGLTVPEFCDRHGVDRFRLQKAMNGKARKVYVDLALGVERATDGEVPVPVWDPNVVQSL